MEKIIKLFKYIDGTNDIPFPSSDNQIEIGAFRYDAKRMGGAPLITAKVLYPTCLDDVWTDEVYATFNGEKYFLKQVPTSSYSHESELYEHQVELVSERRVLDDIYFFDIVTDETENDKPSSNSSQVNFFGDIIEFAKRLNYSLTYSGVGYSVIVDGGVTSEDKLIALENEFVTNALQEIYNTYELPYYFVGKVIHIGSSSNNIEETFRYGENDSLLSISKNNANYKIVNRCTAVGSSDNIPYYYPNETPLGQIAFTTIGGGIVWNSSNIRIKDKDKFGGSSLLDKTLTYRAILSEEGTFLTGNSIRYIDHSEGEEKTKHFSDRNTSIRIEENDHQQSTIKLHNGFGFNDTYNTSAWAVWTWNLEDIIPNNQVEGQEISLDKNVALRVESVLIGRNGGQMQTTDQYTKFTEKREVWNGTSIETVEVDTGVKVQIHAAPNQKYNVQVNVTLDLLYQDKIGVEYGIRGATINFSTSVKDSDTGNDVNYGWFDTDGKQYFLENIGLEIVDTIPQEGYSFLTESTSYIKPMGTLMPPIYRESNGAERFYNATNETYLKPNSEEYYNFNNPYKVGKPKEHIITVDNIKPTITGMLNSQGYRMDMFTEFAYDDDDNDGTEEIDGTLHYKHPYFFGKLRKFDGDNGFNLFDHASESGEMTISMTTGACGSCNFIIGVSEVEGKYYNSVQVDDNGNLLRDDNGNVRCGREFYQQEEEAQDRQQDTTKNEVWIALKKDIESFGEIMPNSYRNYKPKSATKNLDGTYNDDGDEFVILNILLPDSYITNAEEKLKEEIVKYLSENNDEKFNFSITFSRIFFSENESILNQLNENSQIAIEYNNKTYTLYVNSYSYNMDGTNELPEIKVELVDTLTISQTSLQNAISEVKASFANTVLNWDTVTPNATVFLNKTEEDSAQKPITFKEGIKIGDYQRDVEGAGAAISIDGNGNTIAEVDFLKVRKKATFKTITVEELKAIGGELIISPAAMVCARVEELDTAYRCYFNANDETGNNVNNDFEVGDLARCQVFNLFATKYYWRQVVTVGKDYIDLSKTLCDNESDVPTAGDNIVQLGHISNLNRQNAIILSSINECAPRQTLYSGINSFSLEDKEYIDFGVDKSDNAAEAFFTTYGRSYVGARDESQYVKYENGKVTIKGKLEVGTTLADGTDIADAIRNATPEGYDEFVEQVTAGLGSLQQQIDGAIESYFYEYEPLLDNYPANSWDTDEEKAAHLNDTFTNLTDGRSWRWTKSDDVYGWTEITDTATAEALRKAGEAQDTADGKRRVFITEPTTPYDEGDLWAAGSSEPLKRCISSRESGDFNADDWDYADNNSELASQIAGYEYLKKALKESTTIDGGMIQSSILVLGYTDADGVFHIMSGTNGIYNSGEKGGGIAAWYGGDMVDDEDGTGAQSLFRFDGSGYLAGGNIRWDKKGAGAVAGGDLSWDEDGNITLGNGIKITADGDETLGSLLIALSNKYDKSGGDIEGDANVIGKLSMGTLVIPKAEGVVGEYTLEVGELGEGADDVPIIAKIGDLENVNPSANDVVTEDIILIKKGGSPEYTPIKVSDISVNETQIENILINKKYVKQSDILTEDTTLIKKDLIPIERDVGIIIKNSGDKLTIGIDYNEDTFSIDDNNKLNLNNIDGGII